jgi:peroxiredoxin
MAEMPKMVKLYQQQHDKGLEIVGVNLDENEKKLRDTIKEQGVTWTMLFPSKTGSDIAIKWGIMPIPKIIVVDRKGTIRHVDVLGEDLAAAVGKLVDEKGE